MVAYLRDLVQTNAICITIDTMLRAHDISMVIVNGVPCYVPFKL